ncbi:serine protease [Halomicroarcula sp. F13]|uniref:Serine protease n=1 Tax=Haloarcula rubra TaxID=2487747 RepID=A0AAW4PQ62_9EURY|nr:serine protease [Halomicroarcula rubra]MBX0323350.1 serine protease [Halomicroarcula rubra]
MEHSRRSFLVSAAAALGLSGCSELSGFEPTSRRDSGATSGETTNPQAGGVGTDAPLTPSAGTETEPVQQEFSQATRERASEVGTAVRDSVVVLRDGNAGGTGWVVGEGEIVTNAHVADGSPTLSVETFDGATGTAERVGYHEDLRPDLALLETDLSVPPLSLGNVEDLSRGDPLVTVGHPGRLGQWIISLGRYLRVLDGIDWLLSTVPTQRGNSGGPLVTLDGDVVGVVSGSTTGPESSRPDFSRNETAYTEFPELAERTTSVPVDTLEASLSDWR